MVFPREVLNRIKWTNNESLNGVTIWYVHRGAPGDILTTDGDKVISLGRGFFETGEATIPYHRIMRIDFKGETVFDKQKESRRTR